jgi:hypothetical protein
MVQRATDAKLLVAAALPKEREAEFEARGDAHEVLIVDPEKILLRTACEYGDFPDFNSPVLTSECGAHPGKRY